MPLAGFEPTIPAIKWPQTYDVYYIPCPFYPHLFNRPNYILWDLKIVKLLIMDKISVSYQSHLTHSI
jgi:hypothetical protein